jgi:hypothetical protein
LAAASDGFDQTATDDNAAVWLSMLRTHSAPLKRITRAGKNWMHAAASDRQSGA